MKNHYKKSNQFLRFYTVTILLMFTNSTFSQVVPELFINGSWGKPELVNNKIVYPHYTPEFGTELWVTDGTFEGTQLLIDLNPGPQSSGVQITNVIDGYLYFRADANINAIWRTDGTPKGTTLHVSNPAMSISSVLFKVNDYIIFSSRVENQQNVRNLWRMTEVPNSEVPITQTFDGKIIREAGSACVFNETNFIYSAKTDEDGWAIFRSTGVTTDLMIDLYQGNNSTINNIRQFSGTPTNIDGKIYFTGFHPDHGFEPYTTNGTNVTTSLLKDIYSTSNYNDSSIPSNWLKIGSTVYFTARDASNGIEVWKTNGTESSTQMIKDVRPGNNFNSFFPGVLTNFNNQLFFMQNDGTNDRQVWKTDGTEEGTVMVTNNGTINFTDGIELFEAENKLFFSASTTEHGSEVWMMDQNEQLTRLTDIAPGNLSAQPGDFIYLNGYLYFSAYTTNLLNSLKVFRLNVSSLSTNNTNATINEIIIYPNPVDDYFILNAVDSDNAQIEMFNAIGQHVKFQKTSNNKYIIKDLNSGIYWIKISVNNEVFTKKIIKK